MNLSRHIGVLWRFRALVIGGSLLGAVLAVLAAYKVPSMERRGSEVWKSQADVLVTQPGFPWGRVTLPQVQPGQVPGQPAPIPVKPPKGGIQYADPSRFTSLAILYSVIANSDQVLETLPGRPSRDQIVAEVLDPTGTNQAIQPIVKLTTTGESAEAAQRLNVGVLQGLRKLLRAEQNRNDISPTERIQLNVLNAPTRSTMVSGRSLTPSILALVLCVLAAVAAAHLLEALRAGRPLSPDPLAGSSNGDVPLDDDWIRDLGALDPDGPSRGPPVTFK